MAERTKPKNIIEMPKGDEYQSHLVKGRLLEYETDSRNLRAKPKNSQSNFYDLGMQAGVNKYRSGSLLHAKHQFELAVKRNPENPDAYFYLALTLNDLKEKEEAKIYFEKAIKLDPAYAEAYFYLALFLMEDIENKGNEQEENIKRAYLFFDKFIKLQSNRDDKLLEAAQKNKQAITLKYPLLFPKIVKDSE